MFTCVRPCVPLQLVAPCEAFPTENPVADKGPLPSVQPDVGSEKRRFPKRLLAAGDVADVFPFHPVPGPAQHASRNIQSIRRMLGGNTDWLHSDLTEFAKIR